MVSWFLFRGMGCVEFEKDNVSVLHDVVSTLLPVFPSSLWMKIKEDKILKIVFKDVSQSVYVVIGKNSTMFRFNLIITFYTNTHLSCTFTALLFEVGELHHLGHDEAFLKVSVDLSCSLRSLGTFLLEQNGTESSRT